MTLSTTTNRVVAEGNGATTQFSYNFLIPSQDFLSVIFTDADGNSTTIDADDYTVTGINDPDGGLVTYPLSGPAIDAGETLTIVRELPLKQLVSIGNQGAFYPTVVEQGMDRLMMVIQQVNDLFSRAIVAPVTDPDTLLPLPGAAQRANQILGFDADGNPIAAQPSEALVSSAMQPVVAAATLALARTAMGLGSIATLALGRGLFDNNGEATVNSDFEELGVNADVEDTDHYRTFVATQNITLTLARANTYWNGFGFWVQSGAFIVTVAIDANDAFKGQSSGIALTVQPGSRFFISTDADASGVWYAGYDNVIVPMAAPFAGLITPGGRLTLTTAVPVLSSDVTGATTIFYTPYLHNIVSLYDGTSNWVPFNFSEMNQALNDATKSPGAAAANTVYDLFIWNDSGTLRCTRGPAWTSATARGTGAGTTQLELFQGRYVNQVAITNGPGARRGLYVGTIATNASVQCNMIFAPAAAAGGTANRLDVWNMYNRVNTGAVSRDSTNTWSYSTNTLRSANNSTSNRITFVLGLNEDAIFTQYAAIASINANGGFGNGVGLDSTTAIAGGSTGTWNRDNNGSGIANTLIATFNGLTGIGSHFIQALERGETTTTWYGDNGDATKYQMTLQFSGRM